MQSNRSFKATYKKSYVEKMQRQDIEKIKERIQIAQNYQSLLKKELEKSDNPFLILSKLLKESFLKNTLEKTLRAYEAGGSK